MITLSGDPGVHLPLVQSTCSTGTCQYPNTSSYDRSNLRTLAPAARRVAPAVPDGTARAEGQESVSGPSPGTGSYAFITFPRARTVRWPCALLQ